MINPYRLSLRIDVSPSSLVIVNAPRRSGKTHYIRHRMIEERLKDPMTVFEYMALTGRQTIEFKEDNLDFFMRHDADGPDVKRTLFMDEPLYFNPVLLGSILRDHRYTQIIMFSSGVPQHATTLLNGLVEYGFVVIDAPLFYQ